MVKIVNLTPDKYREFIRFNRNSYPQRNNVKKRFEFQALGNPLLQQYPDPPILIACNEHNCIVGQLGLNPQEYYFRGQRQIGFFGYDLFVAEENRGRGIGSSLVQEAIRKYSPFFPIGISKDASKLYSSFHPVGTVRTFIWLRTPLHFFRLGFNHLLQYQQKPGGVRTSFSCVPTTISSHHYTFNLLTNLNNFPDHYWGDGVIEFSRSTLFLQWRFSNSYNYKFYLLKNENKTAYFVVKMVSLKGLSFLAVVDYRVPAHRPDYFKAILKTSQELARKNNCAGVITMSSYSFFDTVLAKEFFLRVGKEQGVFVNCKLSLPLDKIKNNESLIFTMADADLEFSYW